MVLFVDLVLLTFLAVLAVAVASLSNLFAVIVLSAIFSLLTACLYLTMSAVDVAFTEAAVGGIVGTLFFMGTIALTDSHERQPKRFHIPAFFIVAATGLLLMYGVADIPEFGGSASYVHQYLSDRYIGQSIAEIGVPNMVTSILASYRGYDTMGEVTVIFTAGIAVMILLAGGTAGSAGAPGGSVKSAAEDG